MGIAPERLWFDAECEQARAEVRRKERRLRTALQRAQRQQGADSTPASETCTVGGSQASVHDHHIVRQQYIEALRKYRMLRRKKEVACRSSMRSELMECENVREFFQFLGKFDVSRRGDGGARPSVESMAAFFEQSPVAGASFDEPFHTALKGALIELEAELSTHVEGRRGVERGGGCTTAERVAELLGTRVCTATEHGLAVALSVLNSPIDEMELWAVTHFRMKHNKAPGPDGIPAECYRGPLEGSLATAIAAVFNAILSSGRYPDAWRTALLVPLLKNWRLDPMQPTHYRPISLQVTLAKIFAAVLERRLADFLETVKGICPSQFGFIRGRQGADAVFILSTLIQKAKADRKDLYVAFIDFSKAYDSVDRASMQAKLLLEGVRGRVYTVLQSMYEHMRSVVSQGGSVSRSFEHSIGLRQGCVLSPLLFALFIADLPVFLARNGCEGIKLQDQNLNSLWYADDGALLAASPPSLQQTLDSLAQYCDRWRLRVNTAKTKVMACRFSPNTASLPAPSFHYKGAALEVVETFCYLGVPVSNDGSHRAAMEHRVEMARRALGLWSRRCSSFMLRPDTASHLFKVCVLPVLEYGLPIWGVGDWTCKEWNEVEGFVAKTARWILRVPSNSPMDAVYGDLGWRPVWVRALILASNYWTRVADLPSAALPRKALAVQRQLLAGNHSCWLSNIRRQMIRVPQAAGFWNDWWARGEEPDFRAVTTKVVGDKTVHVPWAEDLREAFTAAADEQWRLRVQATASVRAAGGNKLRTYARFKAAIGQEAYLSANMKTSTRQLLCRFRIGVAPLQIELGRRHPAGPGSRACLVCGAEKEDEEHFLMACPLYDELRATLSNTVLSGLQTQPRHKQLLRRWTMGTQARRFNLLMGMQGKDEIRALALYLEKAWALRSTYLALQAAPQALQDQWTLDATHSLAVSGHDIDSIDDRDGGIEGNNIVALASDSDSEVVLEP